MQYHPPRTIVLFSLVVINILFILSNTAVSSKNEHVRVINHKTSSRVLLKGFEGKVTSIMFRGPDDSHLACMDMIGSIRVFLIFEENGELKYPFYNQMDACKHHASYILMIKIIK